MNKKDFSIILTFSLTILLTRTIWHIAPGVEFVTGTSIVAAYLMKNQKFAYLVPIVGLILSDVILGNTVILIFTWSAFALAPLFGHVSKLIASRDNNIFLNTLKVQIISFAFNIFFFLWTNLGVVITTNMYSKNFAGLMESYINGLPFFKIQAGTGLIIAPLVYIVSLVIWDYSLSITHKGNDHTNFKQNLSTRTS